MSQLILPGTAQPSDVRAGKIFNAGSNYMATGTQADNGALGGTITTQGGSYTIPAGITTGGTVTASIAGVKLRATGTATSTTSGISVSGLSFQPRIIQFKWNYSVGSQVYVGSVNFDFLTKNSNNTSSCYDLASIIQTNTTSAPTSGTMGQLVWSRTSSSFTLNTTIFSNGQSVSWEAIE